MDSAQVKRLMLENAQEINRLHARIHDAVRYRDQSPQKRKEWEKACEEFHSRYDALAFPGGYERALEQIPQSDEDAVEAALCFLELRPYFFRSGYMYERLLRKVKRAALSEAQKARFDAVLKNLAEWRNRKKSANAA